MGLGCGGFLDAMIDKGIAHDDLGDQRLHSVAIFSDGFHQTIHDDFVVAFQLATERVGHQLLSQVASQFILSRGDDDLELSG